MIGVKLTQMKRSIFKYIYPSKEQILLSEILPQTNLLHGYIRHIHDIMQLWVAMLPCYQGFWVTDNARSFLFGQLPLNISDTSFSVIENTLSLLQWFHFE